MIKAIKWISVLAISLILISWGSTGHRIISRNAPLSFNEEMELFQTWGDYLASHASDADYRKSEDPNESPRHYIDIDNYSEFVNYGYIPQTLNEAINLHGYNNVFDWGTLPWATKATFDSLKSNMAMQNWDNAKYFAADLGHYVGDGHMPLHITKNYDGQLSDNDGIHSRYESTMIGAHAADLTYTGEPIEQIDNVNQYILDYIYENHKYVDSVLLADDYAVSINSSYSSTEYKNALWEKTGAFTTMLFKNASHALAELIYTAWKEAGSPSLTGIDLTNENNTNIILEPITPNPIIDAATISFHLKSTANIILTVHDINGRLVTTLAEGKLLEGDYSVNWIPSKQSPGIYFIVLNSGYNRISRKVILE
ncbi:MAG: T9SS type A sorting domain-containing protein [Bacteroidales bacterium]